MVTPMHEYSIVQALMEQIENIADENSAQKVTKVIIKVGIMSGVEPHLLEIAFDTFKERTICEDSVLEMNIQPLTLRCRGCEVESELKNVQYCCPECNSLDVEVVDGEEMYLMSLELQQQIEEHKG